MNFPLIVCCRVCMSGSHILTARTAVMRLSLVLVMALLAHATSPALAAKGLASPPILRIESEMHAGRINSVGVDAEGRTLATASDDETVRLWSLTDGRLIRVLRPPIGDLRQGKLLAVALSPDGRSVVSGGWTRGESENAESIYVFDSAAGGLTHRVSGLPNPVEQLAWSPDGHAVVAALRHGGGIRVYETNGWAIISNDPSYGDSCGGLAFDRLGRLATASDDGFVRLYSAQFSSVAKMAPRPGRRPHSVAFSPDASRVAVSYAGTAIVDILSVPMLKRVYSVEAKAP
jgi:WD40 repeat protein